MFWRLEKKILTIILVMTFFAIRTSSVNAVTLDYWGIDLWHGTQGGVGVQSEDLNFTWDGIIFKVGKHLPNPKYRFELTGELGHHRVSGLTHKNGVSAVFAFWLDRDFRYLQQGLIFILVLEVVLAIYHQKTTNHVWETQEQ